MRQRKPLNKIWMRFMRSILDKINKKTERTEGKFGLVITYFL